MVALASVLTVGSRGLALPDDALERDYHESSVGGCARGLDPADVALRERFLLGARRLRATRVLDVGCGEGRFAG